MVLIAPTASITNTERQVIGLQLPAANQSVGSTLRFTVQGICTSTVANLVTFRLRVGPTSLTGVIATSITPTATTTASSAPFSMDMWMTLRSLTSVIGGGRITGGNPSTAMTPFSRTSEQPTALTAVTIANVLNWFELTAVTAAATTSLILHSGFVEILGAG